MLVGVRFPLEFLAEFPREIFSRICFIASYSLARFSKPLPYDTQNMGVRDLSARLFPASRFAIFVSLSRRTFFSLSSSLSLMSDAGWSTFFIRARGYAITRAWVSGIGPLPVGERSFDDEESGGGKG